MLKAASTARDSRKIDAVLRRQPNLVRSSDALGNNALHWSVIQEARAGDMIGMNVRIDYILQPQATLAQQSPVRLRLNRRVDDRCLVRAARGNDVGGASTVFVQELLKIHKDNSS
jgi:hypothetical protein